MTYDAFRCISDTCMQSQCARVRSCAIVVRKKLALKSCTKELASQRRLSHNRKTKTMPLHDGSTPTKVIDLLCEEVSEDVGDGGGLDQPT